MPRHPTADATTASRAASFMRWLVLVVMAFDLLTAPLHAHAHDMGAYMLMAQLHMDGHHDDLDDDDHAISHAAGVTHDGVGHSIAALRTTERESVTTPSLAIIVASVTSLLAEPRAQRVQQSARTAAADHIPIPSRCPWRPEGRAPPVLQA